MKVVAVFLLVASVALGVSYDKYTIKILNGEHFIQKYNYILCNIQYFRGPEQRNR